MFFYRVKNMLDFLTHIKVNGKPDLDKVFLDENLWLILPKHSPIEMSNNLVGNIIK